MRNKILNLFVCSLLSLTAVTLSAQQLKPLLLDSEIRHGRVENGLTYYIQRNTAEKNRANFYIVQNIGVVLEEDSQSGMTHFLEYMAFRGSRHFPGNAMLSYFESLGLCYVDDIYTHSSFDETVYAISNLPTLRSGIVDTTLLVLHDWATALTLENKNLDAGRELILQDWRAKDNASSRMSRKLNQLKFPHSEYGKRSVLGDFTLINSFSAEALRTYYKTWWRPDLQAIVVVGDVNVDELEKKIARLFASVPKRKDAKQRYVFPIKDNEEPIVAIVSDPEAHQACWTVEYKQEVMPSELKLSVNGYLVETINAIITTIMNERLLEISQAPSAPFLSPSVRYGGLLRSKDALSFSLVAQEREELKALEILFSEAERVKRFGFNPLELERAKLNVLNGVAQKYSERKAQKNESLAEECFAHFLHSDPIPGLEWEYKSLQSMLPQIDTAMINKIVAGQISDKNIIISLTAPRKTGLLLPNKAKVLKALALSKQVDLKPNKEMDSGTLALRVQAKTGRLKKEKENSEPGFTEWTLGNGIRVLLKPTEFKTDEILMMAFSEGGLSKIDNVNDLPAAMLSAELVSESGIGGLSKLELQRFLQGARLSVKPFISDYSQGIRAYSSQNDFENLLKLTHLYFVEPKGDKAVSNLLKDRYKLELLNRSNDPKIVFSETMAAVIAGNNPRNFTLNTADISQIDPGNALKIYKQIFANPAAFTFVFVGNINPKDAKVKKLILTYLGGLKSKRKSERFVDRNIRMPQTNIKKHFKQKMQTPISSNAIVFSNEMAYNRENKLLMNCVKEIINVRYNAIIREKGFAISPVSLEASLSKIPIGQAVLTIRFDVDTKNQDRMLKMLCSDIYKIISSGVSADDLQRAKIALLKKYDENLSDNNFWLESLVSYANDELDFFSDYRKAVLNIDNARLKTFLKSLIVDSAQFEFVMNPGE